MLQIAIRSARAVRISARREESVWASVLLYKRLDRFSIPSIPGIVERATLVSRSCCGNNEAFTRVFFVCTFVVFGCSLRCYAVSTWKYRLFGSAPSNAADSPMALHEIPASSEPRPLQPLATHETDLIFAESLEASSSEVLTKPSILKNSHC